MKVAIIADIHGNTEALRAVLHDIEKENVDITVCAGDFVNPLSTSIETFEILKQNKIPIIRGNHEDYVIDYFRNANSDVRSHIRFQPVQLVAKSCSIDIIEELENLPMDFKIKHPSGQHLHIFHASPKSNRTGFFQHISAQIKKDLLESQSKNSQPISRLWAF